MFNRLAIQFELHGHFLPQPARQHHFTFNPFARQFQLPPDYVKTKFTARGARDKTGPGSSLRRRHRGSWRW
jgi:hypothetical protein